MQQTHLNERAQIQMGSYYTPLPHVRRVYEMIRPYLSADAVVLDTACGYGGFFSHAAECRKIGADIDAAALSRARREHPDVSFVARDALVGCSREQYGIGGGKLIVVGNPPYNDRTSQVKREAKRAHAKAQPDPDLAARDAGLSFLRSYGKLRADVVCVLHPLSYLIKRANFNAIKPFAQHYRLVSADIVSSAAFAGASGACPFPIVIALYERAAAGTDYEDVWRFPFRVSGDVDFVPGDFDYLNNYLRKYPQKTKPAQPGSLFFWTMRDINALRRNRTFLQSDHANAVFVEEGQLPFYVYADVFKRMISRTPFYMGNCDIPIDARLFGEYRNDFFALAAKSHHFLKKHLHGRLPGIAAAQNRAEEYMQKLLGAHYVRQG